MADFEKAIEKTLKYEGGYSNNPNDPGGATNLGITLKELQSFGLLYDYNSDGIVDAEDIKALTVEDAKHIYKRNYWKADKITSQAIGEKYFDICVNMGVVQAGKLLQQACNVLGSSLVLDGAVGPQSIKEINSKNESALMTEFCALQENFYWTIVKNSIQKNASRWGWSDVLISDVLEAVNTHNLELTKSFIKRLRSLGLKPGNIIFIPGWIKRARDRFCV